MVALSKCGSKASVAKPSAGKVKLPAAVVSGVDWGRVGALLSKVLAKPALELTKPLRVNKPAVFKKVRLSMLQKIKSKFGKRK